MAHLRTNGLFRNGLIATTGALALTTASSAEFQELLGVTSVVDQTGWSATDPRTLVQVSVYALFNEDTDQLISVYGDAEDPLSITTTDNGGFYQFNAAGAQAYSVCNTSLGINTALPFSSQTSDSFVTIGFASSEEDGQTNKLQNIGVDFAEFNPPTLIDAKITTDNGGWFCTPDDFQTFAGNFVQQILIGQFTVAAGETVSGTVNLQWRDGDGTTTYTTQSFSLDAVVTSVRGDLNGDGFADITLQRDDHERMRALMGRVDPASGALDGQYLGANNLSGFTSLATADVTGNGRSDIVIQKDNKQVLGFMSWDGVSEGLDYTKINGADLSDWTFVGLGDINGDGINDIVFQKTSGPNAFRRIGAYLMSSGVGTWQTLPPRGDLSNWTLLGCHDLNDDGFDDIVMQKNTLNRLGFYATSFAGGVVGTSYTSLSNNNLTGYTHCGFADLDGNGEGDTLFRKDTNDKIRTYWGDSGNSKTFNVGVGSTWNIIGGSRIGGGQIDVILMQKENETKMGTYTKNGQLLDYAEVNANHWAGWQIIGY
jgi:hypothetical protein